MASLEVGRVCMKIAGREAGKYCVVIKKFPEEKGKSTGSFVLVTGPKLLTGIKRRKANVDHLEPLPYIVEIKEEADDEEVIAALDKAGLISKFNLKKPSAAEMKAERAKPKEEKKAEVKEEEKEITKEEEKPKKEGKKKKLK